VLGVRLSVGVGLGVSIGAARLEFNYSVPLRATAFDRGQPFQLGVQLNFI